mmetsp:Transcript_69243/g.178469  ORF Transcript_69243/g.178469 Transcript_69243/m.178469 type:complete len:410 (-) Transcript_69243:15-1244(-)
MTPVLQNGSLRRQELARAYSPRPCLLPNPGSISCHGREPSQPSTADGRHCTAAPSAVVADGARRCSEKRCQAPPRSERAALPEDFLPRRDLPSGARPASCAQRDGSLRARLAVGLMFSSACRASPCCVSSAGVPGGAWCCAIFASISSLCWRTKPMHHHWSLCADVSSTVPSAGGWRLGRRGGRAATGGAVAAGGAAATKGAAAKDSAATDAAATGAAATGAAATRATRAGGSRGHCRRLRRATRCAVAIIATPTSSRGSTNWARSRPVWTGAVGSGALGTNLPAAVRPAPSSRSKTRSSCSKTRGTTMLQAAAAAAALASHSVEARMTSETLELVLPACSGLVATGRTYIDEAERSAEATRPVRDLLLHRAAARGARSSSSSSSGGSSSAGRAGRVWPGIALGGHEDA